MLNPCAIVNDGFFEIYCSKGVFSTMFLLNRLTFLILAASMYGQLPTPLRYSLKSFDLDNFRPKLFTIEHNFTE